MLETNNPTKWPEVEWGDMYNFLKETLFFIHTSRDISFGTSCKDFPVYSECILTLSNLGKIVSRLHTEIFFSYFSQKTEFDISPLETIRIRVVSPVGRFAGSFRPGSFRPCFWGGSFRPY